jgi:ligand-binding sensor domain-containing protein
MSTIAAGGLKSRAVYAFLEGEPGELWVGSSQGLLRAVDDGLVAVVREQGLTFFRVLQLARDASGHLWLGSERGTFRAPEADQRDLAVWRRTRVEGRSFGRDDGRPSRQCNGGAASSAMRTANGEVWFATARGLAVVDPVRIDDRPRTPPPERRATRRVAQRCLR